MQQTRLFIRFLWLLTEDDDRERMRALRFLRRDTPARLTASVLWC